MKTIKSFIPFASRLALVLFSDNTMAVRVENPDGSVACWRDSQYPEKDGFVFDSTKAATLEVIFQSWRTTAATEAKEKHALSRKHGAEQPMPVDELLPPSLSMTRDERISMLEQAVGLLMGDRKARMSNPAPQKAAVGAGAFSYDPFGSYSDVVGRPAKSMAEAVQAKLDQEAMERCREEFRRNNPSPLVDELPGEVQLLKEILVSLGYQVNVVRR